MAPQSWHLIYNSTPEFLEVASGEGDTISVSDDDLYELFKKVVVEKKWKEVNR